MHTAFEPKDFAVIGKLHAYHNPDDALTILENYKASQAKALDTDLHRLNYYYLHYCKIFDINPFEYLGSLHTSEKIDRRRLFIGTMVRIYMPQLLTHEISYRTGFGEALCIVLHQDAGNLSKTIDECTAWMKTNYESFMDDVQGIIDKLISRRMNSYGTLFDAA